MFNDPGKSKYWEVWLLVICTPFIILIAVAEKYYNKLKDYVRRKRSTE